MRHRDEAEVEAAAVAAGLRMPLEAADISAAAECAAEGHVSAERPESVVGRLYRGLRDELISAANVRLRYEEVRAAPQR
jgi:hypothetical protein